MSNFHRTQIYIDIEQMHRLKNEARKEKLSISELIRRAIQDLLETRVRGVDWEGDPLSGAIGKVKLEDNDASIDHDHYLYGSKKKA